MAFKSNASWIFQRQWRLQTKVWPALSNYRAVSNKGFFIQPKWLTLHRDTHLTLSNAGCLAICSVPHRATQATTDLLLLVVQLHPLALLSLPLLSQDLQMDHQETVKVLDLLIFLH